MRAHYGADEDEDEDGGNNLALVINLYDSVSYYFETYYHLSAASVRSAETFERNSFHFCGELDV